MNAISFYVIHNLDNKMITLWMGIMCSSKFIYGKYLLVEYLPLMFSCTYSFLYLGIIVLSL